MARLLRRTSLKAGIRQVQRAGTGAQCELAENQTCTKTLQAAERSMADSTSCTHVAQMAILRKPTIAQGFVPAFPVEQQTVQPLHRYPHIDIFCGLWRDVLLEGPSTTAPASTTARPSNRSDTC
jgi:hypothetical protein